MKLVLHIDRLALRGFAQADRHAIVEGLRDALALQLAAPGAIERLAALPATLPRLDAGAVGIAASTAPSSIGARLGGAIAKGLRR